MTAVKRRIARDRVPYVAIAVVAAAVLFGLDPFGGGLARGAEIDYGRLHPDAPPETAQFSFIVGPWACRTKFRDPDGDGFVEGRATWTGRFILDGWAIQDDWTSLGPDGKEFHGTNIRSFNPKTRKWDNRWLPSGSLQWKYFEAEKKGDTMVMIGGEGRDPRGAFVDRNVFHDITPEGWRWRKDRSYDGGATWIEGIGFIEASRPKTAS